MTEADAVVHLVDAAAVRGGLRMLLEQSVEISTARLVCAFECVRYVVIGSLQKGVKLLLYSVRFR